MSDEDEAAEDEAAEEEEAAPAVELGDGEPVDGAPLARVTARLSWGIERSTIREREGDTVVRTPSGPTELATLLDDVDVPYFATRQEFREAIDAVTDDGPVPTAE